VNSRRSAQHWLWYGGPALVAAAVCAEVLLATRGRNLDVRVIASVAAPLLVLVIARILGLTRKVQRTQTQLGETEWRYRALVEQIPAIVYTFEVDGRMRYVSPYVEAMYGFTPAEWLAQPELWLERMAPEDRERVVTQENHSRATGEPFSTEYRVRARDGRVVWVREDANVIDREGKPFLLQGVILDVTVRREAEAAIERLNAELEGRVAERTAELEGANRSLLLAKETAERANQAKSEFVSRASHELRTPMNAILGFGQLLEGSALSPNDRDSVEQILMAGRRLLDVINDVLDLSRIEANRLSLSIEPVSVSEVVRECLDLVRPIAAERGVDLRVESLDRPGHVLADRERFKEVLINLLSNAIQYNRDRDGTVVVSGYEVPGQIGVIQVSDTGAGIPPDALDRLFAPFGRIDASRTGVGGRGLGLAMSKALTEAMGGRIKVESRPGQGAAFSVELPMAAEPRRLEELMALPEEPQAGVA